EASEKFRRVLELESDNPDAHFHLGELALRRRNLRDAHAAFRLVIRLDPTYPEARRRLASLLLDENEVGEARKHLRRELREFRRNPSEFSAQDLDDFGRLLLDARLPKDAIRVFRTLLDKRPNDAEALHHLSVCYFQAGNRSYGMEACRRALRVQPRYVPALHNMALAYMQERQYKRARQHLAQALAIEPDDPALRRLRMTLRVCRVLELAGRMRPFGLRRPR
ncbi:MAG: tetratricopeptide repeat protein, partial [Phycisphaerales bacterium]|nr:tetratricopeptide repeat protein [Phycisphaerales bacterium]